MRDRARDLLRDAYGLDADVHLLAGEFDLNFRVDAGDARYLLKVMRADCDPALVDMQCRVLDRLAARLPELPLQRLVRTRDGAATATVADADGRARLAWLLTFLPGRVMAEARPHHAGLHDEIGWTLGRIDAALAGFAHPACARELKWEMRRSSWARAHVGLVADPGRRALAASLLDRFAAEIEPRLDRVRTGVIYNDANDYNLLVEPGPDGLPRLSGIVDFGDLCESALVADVAVAGAYAMMGADDPLAALDALTAAYHRAHPLEDQELALVFPLVLTRLAVSVVNSAMIAREKPDDPYVTVSEAPAWRLLEALQGRDPATQEARLRAACGLDAWPASTRVAAWLRARASQVAPALPAAGPLGDAPIVDQSMTSTIGGDDPTAFDPVENGRRIAAVLAGAGRSGGLGRYGEARAIYSDPIFASGPGVLAARRTRHLGIDVFAPAGTAVHAPLDGIVHAARYRPGALDYGGVVLLAHETDEGERFVTLWGHLSRASVEAVAVGQRVAAGEPFAVLGTPDDNGGWPPHLHLQLVVSETDPGDAVPRGVVDPDDFPASAALSPNPAALLGLADDVVGWRAPSDTDLQSRRAARVPANVKTSYARPVAVVRGWRHLLFDAEGRRYLDAYNNVPHVGHAHPRVVHAVARQLHLLNTNTRYLHESLAALADRLTARLPDPLQVCLFVTSGSEANELALRLARAYTGARDMLVMAHAYHGHTTGTIDISPYKFNHPRGPGAPDWVHVTPQPDAYRGPYGANDPEAGAKYAAQVGQVLDAARASGRRVAGYISECAPSVGGQIVPPPGFLAGVYRRVREAGGVCIADDVQTGLGRLGNAFWGFEPQGVVPDILVLGKPLGNGYPVGAVVTTREIGGAFAEGPEFFSTFGGSTAACAAALAVLDVLEEEGLQARAVEVGGRLLHGLRELQARHHLIGDVRGSGLFLGVELVTDHGSLTPATRQARYVVNRLRERRILIGTEGPHDCVLKIRPPMTFDAAAADCLLEALDATFREDPAQP